MYTESKKRMIVTSIELRMPMFGGGALASPLAPATARILTVDVDVVAMRGMTNNLRPQQPTGLPAAAATLSAADKAGTRLMHSMTNELKTKSENTIAKLQREGSRRE